jgi:hypothetical protein
VNQRKIGLGALQPQKCLQVVGLSIEVEPTTAETLPPEFFAHSQGRDSTYITPKTTFAHSNKLQRVVDESLWPYSTSNLIISSSE